MKFKPNLIIFLYLVSHSIALPTTQEINTSDVVAKNTEIKILNNLKNFKFNYASTQSQIIATNLLKESIDTNGNNIYSPLGISSILAILAEGSNGDTYREFMTTLGYPENKIDLRESFKDIFNNFQQKPTDFEETTTPTFKTWFYIYRNNTARQEFKEILKNFYNVEVKDIDNLEFNWNQPDTATTTSALHEKEVNSFLNSDKDGEKTEIKKAENPQKLSIPAPVNSKDIIEFEDLKKSEPFDDVIISSKNDLTNVDDIIRAKETSKFDAIVDDKQYVEVPIIKEEIVQQQMEETDVKHENDESNLQDDIVLVENIKKEYPEKDEDNETIKDEEKFEELKKNIDNNKSEGNIEHKHSDEPEKITIPIQTLTDDGEILEAVESRRTYERRSLLYKDDIASALSANSLTGRDSPSKTKILLFNGLYYRGNWAYPFQELRLSKLKEKFYVSKNKSMLVDMMRTHGQFRMAKLDSLNSQAIELPYENNRYSFILIVPNEYDGLHKLIDNLQPVDLQLLTANLVETKTSICLPKFEVEETSRSEKMLKKLGLKKIFSKYLSDLSDMSEDTDLHVEEIVQHVNLRVDEGAASKNSLTASNPGGNEARSDDLNIEDQNVQDDDDDDDEKSLIINRPFLYFVLDQINNFVIVAGKISIPEIKEEFGLADDN